jgi:hypothetical protein
MFNPTTGQMERFTFAALTTYMGGGGGDVTAPTVVSATVQNANPNQVVIVFSESVTATTAGWSFRRNTSNWAVSSVAGSGTTWTFTMATSAANGETIDRSYNSTTGATVDGSGNELVSFTNSAVTNNIASALAAAFIAAVEAGGTALSPTIESALGALETVINGIGASKFDAVYPFCGGAAQSHKWNFMNPLDTDAGFRGTFAGTVTHNANGITGNATDGYMDTKFNPSTHSTANNIHMAVYISAGTAAGRHGCNSDSNAKNLLIGPTISGSDYIRCYGTASDGQIVYTNSDRTDSFILSRRSGTDFEAYKGGVSQGTATGSTGVASPPNSNVYVLAENAAGTAGSFADDTVQFFSLGEGLTDAEATALHNGIVAFQTALSR